MSLNRIDRLFKSAFRTQKYAYKDAYWKAFESQLGPTPKFLWKTRVGSFITIFLAALLTSTNNEYQSESKSNVNNPSSQANLFANQAIGTEKSQRAIEFDEPSFKNQKNSNNKKVLAVSSTGSAEVSEKQITDLEAAFATPSAAKKLQTKNNAFRVKSLKLLSGNSIKSLKVSNLSARKLSPLPDETEFGVRIKKSSQTTYFIQGGAYYHKLNPGSTEPNTIPSEFEPSHKSFSLSGAEILIGAKRKGFIVKSGIGVSNVSKTYAYRFSETSQDITQEINTNTHLSSVDSTFSHYEIQEENSSSGSNFDIAQSVYVVDSNFVTTQDTITSKSVNTIENNVALAYQLTYVNIPIYVGYEIEHKRFFANLTAGFTVGVLSNYHGYKYNESSEGYKTIITSKDLNPVTLGYNVSAGFGYNITPVISIMAQPSYSSTLIGAFKSNRSNQLEGFGGKVGLRYQF